MAKLLLSIYLFVLPIQLCLAQQLDFHNKPNELLHTKALYATVKVANDQENGGGSGFVVRSEKIGEKWHNIVLQSFHTIDNEENMWVYVPRYENWSKIVSYEKYPTYVYAGNEDLDFAMSVFVSDKPMHCVDVNVEPELYIDTKVFHVGYGLMDDARVDHGAITSPGVLKPAIFKGLIRTSCFTYMGDSGGPLLTLHDYKVVAICTGIRGSSQAGPIPHISYYRSTNDFKKWDDKQNNVYEEVYNKKAELPVLPFIKLKLRGYDISLPE